MATELPPARREVSGGCEAPAGSPVKKCKPRRRTPWIAASAGGERRPGLEPLGLLAHRGGLRREPDPARGVLGAGRTTRYPRARARGSPSGRRSRLYSTRSARAPVSPPAGSPRGPAPRAEPAATPARPRPSRRRSGRRGSRRGRRGSRPAPCGRRRLGCGRRAGAAARPARRRGRRGAAGPPAGSTPPRGPGPATPGPATGARPERGGKRRRHRGVWTPVLEAAARCGRALPGVEPEPLAGGGEPQVAPALGRGDAQVAGGHRRRDAIQQLLGHLVAAQIARRWRRSLADGAQRVREAGVGAGANAGVGGRRAAGAGIGPRTLRRGARVGDDARVRRPAGRGWWRSAPRPCDRNRSRGRRPPGASRRPRTPPSPRHGRAMPPEPRPGRPGGGGRSQTTAASASAPAATATWTRTGRPLIRSSSAASPRSPRRASPAGRRTR